MKIECSIRRKGGTIVTFDATSRERLGVNPGTYHFKPISGEPDAPHVADVTDRGHIDRFLSIGTYRAYEAPAAPALPQAPSAPVAQVVPVAPAADGFDAKAVQGLSVRALKEVLPTLSGEQAREVLALEEADADPRASVTDLLVARIRQIEAGA